jgi:hypothetical protein
MDTVNNETNFMLKKGIQKRVKKIDFNTEKLYDEKISLSFLRQYENTIPIIND